MKSPWTAVRVALCACLLLFLVLPSLAQKKRTSKGKSTSAGRKAAAPTSPWPPFSARHSEWVRKREMAATTGGEDPNPLTQYLVGEILVTGVFETDSGPGVFLYATPTKSVFFAQPGAALYNGRIAEIRVPSNGFVSEDAEIVFVERSPKKGDERQIVRRVESSPTPEPEPEPPALTEDEIETPEKPNRD